MHQMKYMGDRREVESAGAYRLAQELTLTFQDTPFEQSLSEAVKGAIASLEDRVAWLERKLVHLGKEAD